MPSEPGRPERIGFRTFLGCCWGLGFPGERIQNFRQQKRCLGPSWFSQVNFCPHPSRHRRISSKSFREFWQAALRARLHIILRRRRLPFQRTSCCPGSSWSAATPSSRPCRRSTTVPSWCLRDRFIFLGFGLVQEQKSSPLTASSPAILRRMRSPPSRPAEVVRLTPLSRQQ